MKAFRFEPQQMEEEWARQANLLLNCARIYFARSAAILFILTTILILFKFGSLVWAAGELFPGEIPPDDFRITHMGPDGDATYLAKDLAAAYNSQRDQFLVVWQGSLQNSSLLPRETEIFGQLINAATGSLIGDMKRISFMGLDGDNRYEALQPALAYNPAWDDFLVVWEGNESTTVPNLDEYEIWGQRLSYNAFGALVSTGNELRISGMGPDGNAAYRPFHPAAAYNPDEDRYLVVWESDDNMAPLVDDEYEIFGQEMEYTADVLSESGSDFRISDMGPAGDPNSDAFSPAVAFNKARGEYLIVWSGNEDPALEDFEIWGRRIYPGGSFDDQDKYSDMGPAGELNFFANEPALVYNPDAGEWLVVWEGNQVLPAESEIYGQVLGYTPGGLLIQKGQDDFRISDMGPDRYPSYYASAPQVDYDPGKEFYLVVWNGYDDWGAFDSFENEIFAQLVGGKTRAEVGYNDFPLSDMGIKGDGDYSASSPAIAFSTKSNNFLITWQGDDDRPSMVDDEVAKFWPALCDEPAVIFTAHH